MTIHLTRTIDSEHLNLPELKPFIGRKVSITIEESKPEFDKNRWKALEEAAKADLVDPEVYKEYREFERAQQEAAHDSR